VGAERQGRKRLQSAMGGLRCGGTGHRADRQRRDKKGRFPIARKTTTELQHATVAAICARHCVWLLVIARRCISLHLVASACIVLDVCSRAGFLAKKATRVRRDDRDLSGSAEIQFSRA
jgi:hypothetical protein